MGSQPLRVFYFDIDGTLTDYSDAPKAALAGGALERALKDLSFGRLVCVSGWADLTANARTRAPEEERARAIHDLLRAVFPDRDWFLSRLALGTDADHRCRQIDLGADWWYADDWAEKFFVEHFGVDLYERELGKHVLRVDPFADGSDVLAWLARIPRSRDVAARSLIERSGQVVAETLGEILAVLDVGSQVDTSAPGFRKVASAFEFFIPAILRREYRFWEKESLDGFRFAVARKTGPNAAEFLGLAILILDQTWIAMDMIVELTGPPWAVRKVSCKLGEPGTGVGGLSTVAYRSPEVPSILAGLPERRGRIPWLFLGEAGPLWPEDRETAERPVREARDGEPQGDTNDDGRGIP